jgi:hypothetical protein
VEAEAAAKAAGVVVEAEAMLEAAAVEAEAAEGAYPIAM